MQIPPSPWAHRPETLDCAVCPEGLARRIQERRNRTIGRHTVEIEDDFYRCESCGEEFYIPEQMEDAEENTKTALREQRGVLLPSEIRAIRERLGLTQYQFEDLLGVGRNTVVRWESGQVWPNAATNALLRLLEANPENARLLAQWHGVELGTAA